MASQQFYGTDLAFIHDDGFTRFARDAAKGLVSILRSVPDRHVVELGCGSGRMAKMLLNKGFTVSGVDISPPMVALARAIAPRGTFSVGSLWDYAIPDCGAVVSVGEVLNYTFDGRASVRRLRGLFRRVYDALYPSGLFVFDFLCVRRSGGIILTRSFTEGHNWMLAVEKKDSARSITRRIVTFRKSYGSYKKAEEIHTIQRLDEKLITSLVRNAGFTVKTRRGYLDLPFEHGHIVMVGKKPKSG